MARLRSSGGWRRSSTPNGKAEAGGDFLRFEGRNTIIMHEPIWKKRNARAELTEGGGGGGDDDGAWVESLHEVAGSGGLQWPAAIPMA
jgi:hypothetical protein